MKTRKELKEYLLDNWEVIREIASEINGWNCSLEYLEVWDNDEEFFNTYFEGKPYEVARATFFGDWNFGDEYVKFNGYGNLESLSEWQYKKLLKDSVDEVIDLAIEYWQHIDIVDDEVVEYIESLK